MNSENHLEILLKGVEYWNDWRTHHPDIIPYLVGADLSHLDLGLVNLKHALLIEAKFKKTFLVSADLSFSELVSAEFEGASMEYINLKGANLTGANFSYADLENACLKGANLSESYFLETTLILTEFGGNKEKGAKFIDCWS